ncbi:MAG: hypothetical protein C0417_05930 [Chlorobiaceae bacterium]|nr:hypothetical protein [Chlorobiaceae bacterium]
MNTKTYRLLTILILATATSAAQVTLQPWTQVYGTISWQRLGLFVMGIKPTTNLPYRVAIYSGGKTSFYRLQTPTDTTALLSLTGENAQIGDLNGDGFTDIVLRRIGNSPLYIDTVVIYWGMITGIDTITPTKLTGSNLQEDFGSSISIGNIIADSTPDLIVGAPQYFFGAFLGRVYIYKGGSLFLETPSVILTGDSANFNLGINCAVGDINNDGFNDLIARGWYALGPDSVRFDYVDVWFGGVVFDTTRDMMMYSKYINGSGLSCFDANGDGIADLLWTHRNSMLNDEIFVHFGKANFDTIPSLRLQNPGVANFGSTIINAGDMNGDGYNDIAVAAFRANITSGFVFIFGGGPKIDGDFDAAVGMSSDADFGYVVASVGDINSDGLSDVIVGAPSYAFGNEKGYWGIFIGDTAIHVTDVKNDISVPAVFKLFQSYPNPFNPKATIKYQLIESAYITLEIFNMLGQRVKLLVDKYQVPGTYESIFDGTQLSSGVYMYKLTAKTNKEDIYSNTKKLTLIK